MNLATYARRNLFRRRGRTILTIMAVTLAVVIFCAIRTFIVAWNSGADEAAADRIATRHKVSITMQLPKHYIEELREIPGIKAATWANWFGAKDPKERLPFFAGLAVDHNSWFDVEDEMSVPPDQLAAWKETANGAILGDQLAKALEVQVGSRLVITSDIYPGDWEFKVVGIYTPRRKTVDRNTLVFRWDYLNNDSRAVYSKEHLGWMVSRITDSAQSADISRRIDAKFDSRDDQTLTMSERAFALSFLGGFAAVLTAFNWVSLVILLIMTLILANTLAMSVRERTHEYGVLRAIGFPPGHILGFILGESLLIALVGGVIGVGLVALVINHALGPAMEANMSGVFQHFFTPGWVLVVALGAAAVLGLVAGAVPAILASRLKITDALRRLG
ncbi:MAG TPA: ABC transporter permease [Kofleriaceae bacterium]|jgi:putative ABC transport system permease protein|nr:ABC transporter permease [Kofleriaceae bacterium]